MHCWITWYYRFFQEKCVGDAADTQQRGASQLLCRPTNRIHDSLASFGRYLEAGDVDCGVSGASRSLADQFDLLPESPAILTADEMHANRRALRPRQLLVERLRNQSLGLVAMQRQDQIYGFQEMH